MEINTVALTEKLESLQSTLSKNETSLIGADTGEKNAIYNNINSLTKQINIIKDQLGIKIKKTK
jgi:hypothetical protein